MKETMKKVLMKAPPPERDEKKCDKGDTNYRSVVSLRNHETMQHKEVLEVMCKKCEFKSKCPSNLERHMNRQHKKMRITRN